MKRRFTSLWNNLGLKDGTFVFALLEDLYTGKHRHYHTLRNHIRHSLQKLDEHSSIVTDPRVLELIIWLHDVIYVAGNPNNEELSAAFAYDVLTLKGAAHYMASEVKSGVLATKHPIIPQLHDHRVVVDLDLVGLAKPFDQFMLDSKRLRREFHFKSDSEYIEGRNWFFRKHLERESIYLTSEFRDKYELAARSNLERVLSH